MNSVQKKMSMIMDELFGFLFHVGATDIDMNIHKHMDGYSLTIKSDFLPQHRNQVEKMRKFLKPEQHDDGLEEVFWQIAGISSSGKDSELHLIGQMLDSAEIEIGEDSVSLILFKKKHPV